MAASREVAAATETFTAINNSTQGTYNVHKDIALGEKKWILLTKKNIPIAYVKSDDMKLSPEMQDISSKMTGKYKTEVLSSIKWSFSVEAIISNTPGHISFDALLQMAASGKPFDFKIVNAKIVPNASTKEPEFQIGNVLYQGKVTIADVDRKSSRGEYETCSATLNGYEALLDGNGKEVGTMEALRALGLEEEAAA